MREPSEAADDVGMVFGIARELIVAVAVRELHAALLIGPILRVHERQIEELTLRPGDLLIEAARKRTIGRAPGRRVGRIGARLAAEHIARELIEHDDERERALRRLLPWREPTFGGSAPEAGKARGDLGIEGRVFLEPFVRAGRAPEGKHVRRSDRLVLRVHAVRGHSRIRPALMSANSPPSRRTNALRCGSLK
jgi:hypothetical protein